MSAHKASKDLVFVASGGRTGTTFLGERLEEVIAGCHSQHEPDVLGRSWKKNAERFKEFGVWHMLFGRILGFTGLRVVGQKFLSGDLDLNTAAKRMRHQRESWHKSIEKPLIVESSGRNWMIAPVLQEAFPNSRIVGVIRDPRSWIESWIRHFPERHATGYDGWWPQGPLTPEQVGDTDWEGQWEALGQFGRLAWDWRIITRELAKADAATDNVHVFRFEDLFDPDNDAEIGKVVRFIAFDGKYPVADLDGFTKSVRNASSGPRVVWQDWEPEKAALVDAMCGELMREYGYGNEPEWLAKVEEAKALAKAA